MIVREANIVSTLSSMSHKITLESIEVRGPRVMRVVAQVNFDHEV